MTTTGSSSPCSAKCLPERWLNRAARLVLCLWLAWLASVVGAQPMGAEVTQARADVRSDGLYFSAQVQFELAPAVEDALLKGIPIVFLLEADVYRARWYWYDKKLLAAQRYVRLAYQPLTRRWRVQTGREPTSSTGLGTGFSQNFDSLPEALTSVRRVVSWRIGDAADLEADQRLSVDFRFKLDVSQLPRPFQIGAIGLSDWSLEAGTVIRIAPQALAPAAIK